ncbi:hypothetical protein EYF80_045917 [Liparis tanakae]|uniref:Uncharacterized protein n=1 Tax=Liparis tanakae TaxID=230148 RepID=A0A4Z2FSJ1_9TELE|nr:hypothetical protein EYF80_045917 [Liparis tanakae]
MFLLLSGFGGEDDNSGWRTQKGSRPLPQPPPSPPPPPSMTMTFSVTARKPPFSNGMMSPERAHELAPHLVGPDKSFITK